MRPVLLALAAFFVTTAFAADYRSKFGYSFQLSDDWLVLSSSELAKLTGEVTPQSLGLTGVEPSELKQTLAKHLTQLQAMPVDKLLDARYDKFRHMGQYFQVVQ